ncbi:MAG: hypothetical protein Tp1125DCM238401_32 [Prokaryotic dsDNA virus sp.]|nr:MAG: hypothetical protein Tp1125DCM238401_32 [Prokaryotic dsDNA virus sp.]
MTIEWTAIAVPLLTASLLGLVGFVWKWSHKVTRLEQQCSTLKSKVLKLEADHDKVMDKMYSMIKSRPRI